MKISFFHRPKPRQFDYKPRYWDPEKEEEEERKKRIERAGGLKNVNDIKEDLRYNINRQWRRGKQDTTKNFNTVRFLIYLFMIIFFVYVIFFTDFVNKFLSYFVG